MRSEFTRKTKQEALKRSKGQCEGSGTKYGLREGERCVVLLVEGFAFDHIHECREGGDNSLKNCLTVCHPCHQFKTNRTRQDCDKSDRLAGRKEKTRSKWKWGKRPMDGTIESGLKKGFDGKVTRRHD